MNLNPWKLYRNMHIIFPLFIVSFSALYHISYYLILCPAGCVLPASPGWSCLAVAVVLLCLTSSVIHPNNGLITTTIRASPAMQKCSQWYWYWANAIRRKMRWWVSCKLLNLYNQILGFLREVRCPFFWFITILNNISTEYLHFRPPHFFHLAISYRPSNSMSRK